MLPFGASFFYLVTLSRNINVFVTMPRFWKTWYANHPNFRRPRPFATMKHSWRVMYANDRNIFWKYLLRILAIILALAGIIAIAWFMMHNNIRAEADQGDYNSPNLVFLPWSFITLGLSMIWNFTHIVVLLRSNEVIHPSYNFICDFLLWWSLVVTSSLAAVGYFSWSRMSYEDRITYHYSTNSITDTPHNGTLTNATSGQTVECPYFETCVAEGYAMNEKSIVIIVGVTLSFSVMYANAVFPYFFAYQSSCRYHTANTA